MKRFLAMFLIVATSAAALCVYSFVHGKTVNAQPALGPLFSSRERMTLTRNKETGAVTGTLEKGTIAVAYVNLWSRQSVERASAVYIPTVTITQLQPAVLFSHCDLPYKFSIRDGRLEVSGSCANANWAEPPIDVLVLYSK